MYGPPVRERKLPSSPDRLAAAHRCVGRPKAGASAGQGRGARAPTGALAASVDGTQQSAGYTRSDKQPSRGTIDIGRIRHAVPITAVLARYHILASLKRVGSHLIGCCPIHDGRNKRQFTVSVS